jgi:hypothetical protein
MSCKISFEKCAAYGFCARNNNERFAISLEPADNIQKGIATRRQPRRRQFSSEIDEPSLTFPKREILPLEILVLAVFRFRGMRSCNDFSHTPVVCLRKNDPIHMAQTSLWKSAAVIRLQDVSSVLKGFQQALKGFQV